MNDMETLTENEEEYIHIPERHRTDPQHIKWPWKSEYHRGRSNQVWFRSKERGEKPFVPEGFIEINKERFKVKKAKGKIQQQKLLGIEVLENETHTN